MFSWDRCKLVDCKTVSIVEDVGQISYIFSDKTGTLTRNVMEFKFMLVGNQFYGNIKKFEQLETEEGEVSNFNKVRASIRRKSYIDPNLEQTSSSWKCGNFKEDLKGGRKIKKIVKSSDGKDELQINNQKELIDEFFKVLSVAHMCDVEKKSDGTAFYNGPSPDEVALVEFAQSQGFECLTSGENQVEL